MNKYRIENPNNNKVREYKSRTTEEQALTMIGKGKGSVYILNEKD